jgi:hypothetical protein
MRRSHREEMNKVLAKQHRNKIVLSERSAAFVASSTLQAYLLLWRACTDRGRLSTKVAHLLGAQRCLRTCWSVFIAWINHLNKRKADSNALDVVNARSRCLVLAATFDAWRSLSAQYARAKQLKLGVLARMLRRELAVCFDTWRLHAAELRRQRHVMSGVRFRMLHSQVASAFSSWYVDILDCQEDGRERRKGLEKRRGDRG